MLLAWIILGVVAGSIAGLITGKDNGCATNIVVGMIGSLIGGALEAWLRTGTLRLSLAFTDFNLTSIIVSTIGAVVLIGIVELINGAKKD